MFVQQTQTEGDTEEVLPAVITDFPDTSGDSLEAVDVLVMPDATTRIYSHYQNGNLMVFTCPLSDLANGNLERSDPSKYLEDSATGKFVLSSRSLSRPLNLSEARKILETLLELDLL